MLSEELDVLALDIAQQQVSEARCAQAQPLVCQPFLAQDLLHDGVIGHGVGNSVYSAGRLEANLYARLVVVFLYRLSHDVGSLRCRRYLLLACARLDIVSAGIHGED